MAFRHLLASYKEQKLCDVFQVSGNAGVQCRYGLIFDDCENLGWIMARISNGIPTCFWRSIGTALRTKDDISATWYHRAEKALESHQSESVEEMKSPQEQDHKIRGTIRLQVLRQYQRK